MNLRFLAMASFFYAGAVLAFAFGLLTARRWLQSAGAMAVLGGVLLHALAILVRYRELGSTPVTDWREGAGLSAFILAAATLVVHVAFKIKVAGAFLAPLSLLLVLPNVFRADPAAEVPPALLSPWSPVHISLAYLGQAGFAVATAMAVMYLLMERQLKRKSFGALFTRLPDLEVLDRLSVRFLSVGIALLTLAICTGALWAKQVWGVYWMWSDPRSLLTLITWVLYAALVHARFFAGWRGHRAAVLTVLGFVVMLGSFFGLNTFVQAGRHFGSYQ